MLTIFSLDAAILAKDSARQAWMDQATHPATALSYLLNFIFWFYPDLLLVGDGHVTSVATKSAVVRLMLLSRQYFLYFNLAFNSRKTFISSLESLQTFLLLFWLNFCIVPLICCDLRKFNWVAAFDWRLDQLLLELLLFLESLLHGFDCSLLIDGVIVRLRQTICQI